MGKCPWLPPGDGGAGMKISTSNTTQGLAQAAGECFNQSCCQKNYHIGSTPVVINYGIADILQHQLVLHPDFGTNSWSRY